MKTLKLKLKLFEIPINSPLRVKIKVGRRWVDDMATFHRIDGMYSYCTTSEGKPFHLSASTPVKLVKGRYEISE